MNLKSLAARLELLEEEIRGPIQWRFFRYFAPMDMSEEERAAAESKARAEEEEKNGPIREHDCLCWIIRTVNAPREQSAPQETITGPPQAAQEAQTEQEAILTPPPKEDSGAAIIRQLEEQQKEAERIFQETMNRDSVNRFKERSRRDEIGGF